MNGWLEGEPQQYAYLQRLDGLRGDDEEKSRDPQPERRPSAQVHREAQASQVPGTAAGGGLPQHGRAFPRGAREERGGRDTAQAEEAGGDPSPVQGEEPPPEDDDAEEEDHEQLGAAHHLLRGGRDPNQRDVQLCRRWCGVRVQGRERIGEATLMIRKSDR